MNSRSVHFAFQLVAGAGDALTGLLLLAAPAFALRSMGVERLPSDLILVSFIGAFVFSVGLSYLFFLRHPESRVAIAAVRALWLITGVQRVCVALFVLLAALSKRLEIAWTLVSAYDLAIAAFQLFFLRPNLGLKDR